ncbi:hypothetical protein MKEN_00540700 [Mycena kentingensis (nom. inval.)]|nr:hypothetical protein MKEN_00540700 [Mycena kentingensis (nom. inval.)]
MSFSSYPHLDQFSWPPRLPSPPPRLTGSLDVATGIFYRTPEHPRLRTAQACEKCRTRKAKCSGEHPSCARCLARGLSCEYAKEGRVRGPNKPKRDQPLSLHDKPNYARRRRTTVAGPNIFEPLSTHIPLPLALPRIDTSGLSSMTPRFSSNPTSSKRLSLPPGLDASTLDRFYSPSAYNDPYGSEPPDSATTSSYTDSRRGSFDPPFGLGMDIEQTVHKDISSLHPLSAHSRFPPPNLDGGYPAAIDSLAQQAETYPPAYTHGAYVPSDGPPYVAVTRNMSMDVRASRPSSSRSLSGGSSTSSSSGRASFDGGESAPASAVSGSFPLFLEHRNTPYPSATPYSPHASSFSPHPSSTSSGYSPHATSFSPHPAPAPPHSHLRNDGRPLSASMASSYPYSDSYARRASAPVFDVPHSAPARQFAFAPTDATGDSSASPASSGGSPYRGGGGRLVGWVEPGTSPSRPAASCAGSGQLRQQIDMEQQRQAVMAAAMSGGQPHPTPSLSLQIPTSDARGHDVRPSPLSLSAAATSAYTDMYLESPGLPPPVAVSKTVTASRNVSVGGLAMPVPVMGVSMGDIEAGSMEDASLDVDVDVDVDVDDASQSYTFPTPLSMSRTVSADAMTVTGPESPVGGGRLRAATISGPVA